MGETTIAWCDYTFSPWQGCTKKLLEDGSLHEACRSCYAEARDRRHLLPDQRGTGLSHWGKGQHRRIKKSGWNEPLVWARKAAKAGERRTVFCLSLGDILDEEIDLQPEMRTAFDRTMDIVRKTALVCVNHGPMEGVTTEDLRVSAFPDGSPGWGCSRFVPAQGAHPACRLGGLDWLKLTKRPERWQLIPKDVRPLVWLGTSAADQASWQEMVSKLIRAEGFRGLFVSVEPQVGPIDMDQPQCETHGRDFAGVGHGMEICTECAADGWSGELSYGHFLDPLNEGVSRVIVGGESGPKARPFDLAWARSIREQCRKAGVDCFIKQLGAKASDPVNGIAGRDLYVPPEAAPLVSRRLKDSHGADPSEWPEDLRIQGPWPEVA